MLNRTTTLQVLESLVQETRLDRDYVLSRVDIKPIEQKIKDFFKLKLNALHQAIYDVKAQEILEKQNPGKASTKTNQPS